MARNKKKQEPKEEYEYLRNPGVGLPAQVVGEEFRRIREENDGTLCPSTVVDEARPEEAVLHPAFEWDDEVAGEKWRHHQARNLICVVQAVKVEPNGDRGQPEVAYVSIGQPRAGGAAYVSTALIATNDDVRARVLRDALSQLRSWRRRWEHLSELAGIFGEIDAIDEAELVLAGAGAA